MKEEKEEIPPLTWLIVSPYLTGMKIP